MVEFSLVYSQEGVEQLTKVHHDYPSHVSLDELDANKHSEEIDEHQGQGHVHETIHVSKDSQLTYHGLIY